MLVGKFEIGRTYTFSASHRLLTLPVDHQCYRMHGHNYTVEVVLAGFYPDKHGMLLDFAELDKAVKPVVDALDHQHLNDVLDTRTPTAEFLAKHIYDAVAPRLPPLNTLHVSDVVVWETARSYARFRGHTR